MEIVILSLIVFCIGYVAIILDFRKGWMSVPFFESTSRPDPLPSISIIIAARNEESHIGKTIASVLNQNYPKDLMELIVINDHSEDGTAEVVSGFGDQVRLINFLDPTKINSYKKAAIALAISEAKGNLIVTTDADCLMGPDWLSSMVDYFLRGNYKMLSAPVAYHEEHSFFERLQSIEFSFLIGMGASTIGNLRPTTCNGANLMYEKDVFLEVGGFQGIDHKASGDDELLLHKIAEKYPQGIGFVKSTEAIVYTYPKPTLSEFIAQRRRWASKSTSYKSAFIIFMGIWIWLFNLSLLTIFILALFQSHLWIWALGVLLVKIAIDYFFIRSTLGFFNKVKFRWMVPILSVVHILYFVYIGLLGNVGSYQWKGRQVK